jgi:HEAT repeat protein
LPRSSTSFQPGQSGNPAGRPKGIEALARAHTPAAIAALVDALRSPKERVSAAVALLDRGWGKP